jgi:CubicO group peptidase (beta-lactamase class C family)
VDAGATGVTARPVLAAVVRALEEGRREGVAPALSAAVLRGGALVHASFHGEIPAPAPRPLREDDLFDVASLTKVMATATLAAQLAGAGSLALDAPVAEALPAFAAAGKGRVTVRQLLAHSAGLAAWRPWFARAEADPVAGVAFLAPDARPPFATLRPAFARGRALVSEAVLAEPLEVPPGTRALYSDAGFVALGLLLEARLGAPLARAAEERVFAPLRLRSTFFLDGLAPEEARAHAAGRAFAPTEACDHRHEVNQGAVNDDNAWAMGGAAGHAGVFSTALEVAALGQAWLDAVHGRASLVPSGAAREFARRDATAGTTRALGWDTRSAEGSSLGTRLGRGPLGAIGHLGFTGTSLWIDLDAGIVVALLTNRVHPTRENERIRAFRPRFHDAVADALGVGARDPDAPPLETHT